MSITIPDELLDSSRISADQVRLEVAVVLYQKGGLSIGQATSFSGLTRIQFQRELAARDIPLNYSSHDLARDLDVIKDIKQS